MRTLRLAVVVGSSALLLSPGALAEEPGDKEQEYVESIFFEEVLPAEVGEYEGRLSVESTRRRMEGSRSAAAIYAFPRAQAFFGIIDRLGAEVDLPLLGVPSGEPDPVSILRCIP